ncbi:MAG TPA: fumarylacetoacetate hydrolase family protein [Thermomicrobiales bacterium]|nr:fumarylacetoacetate hydrolase family protein [Thermomicrobiales bacterium]
MRIATFVAGGSAQAAVVAADDTLVPVAGLVSGAPSDVLGVIEGGPALWGRLGAAAASARGGTALDQARLLAPIPRPRRNVFCVGWNYSEHFAEGRGMRGGQDEQADLPEYPSLFSKQPNGVVGPDAAVRHPAPVSDQLDWEVELAVVVGRGGADIPADRAFQHVFGYTIGNDVSVRDVQRRHGGQWFKGKNFDTHLPLGPWIVTTDEIPDPQALHLQARINGVVKQDAPTRFMVFSVARIIEELSRGLALEPGDVILTGTPEGVGFARKPPEFLKPGDVMELEIDKIGVLRNPIVGRGA